MTSPHSGFWREDLSRFRALSLSEPDVRRWPLQDRIDLFFRGGMIPLRILRRPAPSSSSSRGIAITKHICNVPKYALYVVCARSSPPDVQRIFAEHCKYNTAWDSSGFTFDVGGMDEELVREHEVALKALGCWLQELCTPAPADLTAPSFYAEISLRNIARRLGMQNYLPERTEKFVQEAQTHTLQPWQITELLYASSIEQDAVFPLIPADDPLLVFLAKKMNETMDNSWPYVKEDTHKWLGQEENKALGNAMEQLL